VQNLVQLSAESSQLRVYFDSSPLIPFLCLLFRCNASKTIHYNLRRLRAMLNITMYEYFARSYNRHFRLKSSFFHSLPAHVFQDILICFGTPSETFWISISISIRGRLFGTKFWVCDLDRSLDGRHGKEQVLETPSPYGNLAIGRHLWRQMIVLFLCNEYWH